MKKLFIQYPKCTTCKKAKKFLIDNNIEFEDRDITLNNPNEEELKKWIKLSGLDVTLMLILFFSSNKYSSVRVDNKILTAYKVPGSKIPDFSSCTIVNSPSWEILKHSLTPSVVTNS